MLLLPVREDLGVDIRLRHFGELHDHIFLRFLHHIRYIIRHVSLIERIFTPTSELTHQIAPYCV